ncbi:MAG TPA: class I SAM-dependent rRNA methyltransferase [Terriglobales bacterium]|jgi:23S rRNA (cytosine1962-C5)-methyltransferase
MPKKNEGAAPIKISRRGADRISRGHAWVYRSDVSANNVPPGALVSVLDDRGRNLGSAFYSSSSQIALRMLSPTPVTDLSRLVRERTEAAIAYRKSVVSDSNAYRVIFSESDFLPGLIVDLYNDLLVVQILTQAMDAEPVRQTIVSALIDKVGPAGIIERVEPRIRELEQLSPKTSGLIYGQKSTTEFQMNGVRFHFDALEGQKTGAFLDQRENYAAAAQYARGEALDVFCYQGGFALHLAERCSNVTGVDSSRPALEIADQNAALNGRDIEWIEANAFDLLKDFASTGRQYDTIVLDPPAFAKNKQNLPTALRGYKELNLRAMKMLRPGGALVSCSCSYHVSQADFLEMLASAAADARRHFRLVESRGQAKDHPILLTLPETAYLKCFISTLS